MMNPNQNTPGNRGSGPDMKNGFATTLAAMIALILGAPLNEFTQPYVIFWAERTYAPELVQLISIVWMILCWPLVFFAARASILAALTSAGVYLAYRFL